MVMGRMYDNHMLDMIELGKLLNIASLILRESTFFPLSSIDR